MMQFVLILILIILVVAVIFLTQNMTPIAITFIGWHVDTNLAIALLIAILAGALIVILISIPGNIKNGRNASGNKKKLSQIESERDKYKKESEQAKIDAENARKETDKAKLEIANLEVQLASYAAELSNKTVVTPPPAANPAPSESTGSISTESPTQTDTPPTDQAQS